MHHVSHDPCEALPRKWRLLDFGPDECKEPGTMFTILGHGNPLMELIGPDGRLFRVLWSYIWPPHCHTLPMWLVFWRSVSLLLGWCANPMRVPD